MACHIKNDMMDLCRKMIEVDAIIFTTLTYNCTMTAQAKIVIDRNRALRSVSEKQQMNKLASKVGGVIATGGSLGLIGVAKDFYFHIIISYKEDTNDGI